MRRRKHETEKHESEKAESLQKSFFSDDELSEFQTWIQCLSLDNLLKELVFPCETLHENMPNRIGSTTSAKKRSKILNSDSNKTLKTSQDFSLLKQMIRLQAPTPTPIHPRSDLFRIYYVKILLPNASRSKFISTSFPKIGPSASNLHQK